MDEIDRLISMNDGEVRKQVGESFRAQIRSDPAVSSTFFPGAAAPHPAPPPALAEYLGDAATALVSWSLSAASAYGFGRTADGGKAKWMVEAMLNPLGPDSDWIGNIGVWRERFDQLAAYNYGALFAARCATDGVTVERFLKDNPEGWGARLADAVTAPEFLVTRALSKAADPSKFYQGLHLLLYKVERLAPGRRDGVAKVWEEKNLFEKVRPPWTIYEYMQANRFSEQTFLPEVQNAVGRSEITNRFTRSYPMSTHSATVYTYEVLEYTYGKGVADWLSQRRGKYEYLTGAKPSNTQIR
jgi:hypothetical protein